MNSAISDFIPYMEGLIPGSPAGAVVDAMLSGARDPSPHLTCISVHTDGQHIHALLTDAQFRAYEASLSVTQLTSAGFTRASAPHRPRPTWPASPVSVDFRHVAGL